MSPGRSSKRLARALCASAAAACVLALAPGCRREPPVWVELAEHEPEPPPLPRIREARLGDRRVRLVSDGGESRLQVRLPIESWEPYRLPGGWEADLGLRLVGHTHASTAQYALATERRAFEPAHLLGPGEERGRFKPGMFYVGEDSVVLRLAGGDRPKTPATFEVTLRDDERRGIIRGFRFSGRGFSIWPGDRLRYAVDVPADSALRFCTTFEPLEVVEPEDAGTVVFRVEADGETVFEHELSADAEAYAWHDVRLPAAGGEGMRLDFQVEGALGRTAFLAPAIGPADVGTRSARPWGDTRPDVIVFLADTFRADNLAAYGGELGIAPNIDALATESACFVRAWSGGTYTLPGHATLFSGLLPLQAGVSSLMHAIPRDIVTIAEVLRANGYRTGAITDGGVVSQRLGMAQGFDWFDEQRDTIEATVERARDFLRADDGRPAFLFVQTYRTHSAYWVSPETLAEHGERLGIEGDVPALEQRLTEIAREGGFRGAQVGWPVPPETIATPEADAIVRKLRAHYLGGVVDLDRGFGLFRDVLSELGILGTGYLFFTSDHGEAFGEHGDVYHGGRPWEEKARVPLFLHGPGIAARVVDFAASLLDVAPTIGALARVPRLDVWLGTPLTELDRERPVFSFECKGDPSATFALIAEGKKLYASEELTPAQELELIAAYDLEGDPGELRDLVGGGLTWPTALLEHLGPAAAPLLLPMVGTQAIAIEGAWKRELAALGYGADG